MIALTGPRLDLDKLIGDGLFGEGPRCARGDVDVWEDDESFHVEANVPGARPEDVEIMASGDELSISANAGEEGSNAATWHHKGRTRTSLRRSVSLPDGDVVKASATIEAGVLRIVVPKLESARPKRIEVRAR